MIKAGKQKAWKILLALSLSSLCARYSFPQDIAQYFEFIMYLRYPLIAILLVVELYLMVTIIKGLWGARKLSGDPRLHTLTKYQDDEKKLLLALPMAWEPASWYYAIPKFSRKHNQALCQLVTRSRLTSHWLILIGACFAIGSFSYYLLVDWSEITAFILASFSFYSIIFVTANHRVAKNYSVYLDGDRLVINNAFWSFIMINVKDIKTVNQGLWSKADDKEQLMLGRGSHANIELCFSVEQTYLATMGQFPEKISKLWLQVDQPEQLLNQLITAQQNINRPNESEFKPTEVNQAVFTHN